MTILRCTRKLLAELRVKPAPEGSDDAPGWHANLLHIDGYRCVLFTHDETLFSFFTCRPGRLDLKHFPELFGQALFKALLRAGCSQGEVEYLLDTIRELRFATTNNRRVLGSMVEMARMLEWSIAADDGLAGANPSELQRLLNETPYKAIGHAHPLERMRSLLASKGPR